MTNHKFIHETMTISPGVNNLIKALDRIDQYGGEVVAVIPSAGGSVASAFFGGNTFEWVIVVKRRVEEEETA